MYNRDAGAVNKTYAGAFSETGKTQEHCQGHEATRHYLDKTVVREPAREQMLPLSAHARTEIVMLEVAVGVEVETDQIVMTSASDITRFRRRFVASAEEERAFFDISTSNSLQKSSAIQKISVTLLGNHDIVFIVWFL